MDVTNDLGHKIFQQNVLIIVTRCRQTCAPKIYTSLVMTSSHTGVLGKWIVKLCPAETRF